MIWIKDEIRKTLMVMMSSAARQAAGPQLGSEGVSDSTDDVANAGMLPLMMLPCLLLSASTLVVPICLLMPAGADDYNQAISTLIRMQPTNEDVS